MMIKSKLVLLLLGILHLSISGDAVAALTEDIEGQLEKETGSLKNESAKGSFNNPTSEPSEATALKYYNLVHDSDGDDALNLKYVSAIGYIKPIPFGFCEHGPIWAIHHVPNFFFWPPIPKRVCARPCRAFSQRCRASCCETECVYRYVWRCTNYCKRWGWQRVCYDQHNCCKCTCSFSSPYCYL